MIARTRKTKTRSNEDALAAFVQKKAEIDAMLTRLQSLSDDHFNYSPDEISWDHVGTLGYYAELLKRVTDSAFKEGEHAASAPDLRPRPARHQPPGLGLVGERSCSPAMEIIP